MENIDTREWLLTNGLGSFASGTLCDAHTRTYHGWLIAALDPPGQRTLLLSRLDATLNVGGQAQPLGVNFWRSGSIAPEGYRLLRSFQIEPTPTWIWGQADWQLTRQLLMPHEPSHGQPPYCHHRLLVRYDYQGTQPAILYLRPLIADRVFHYQQQAQANLYFDQRVGCNSVEFQAMQAQKPGTPWRLSWSAGHYITDGLWYWDYRYPEETQRGLSDTEDLYSPGCLCVALQPGESVTLQAEVRCREVPASHPPYPKAAQSPEANRFDRALAAEQQRLARLLADMQPSCAQLPVPQPPADGSKTLVPLLPEALVKQLLKAGDQFIVYRTSTNGASMIAGYPWFNDWGRDTLISLPGLTLTTRRWEIAKGLLRTFGQHCQQGLIPNAFPDAGTQPFYNSLDAALWWIETLGLYLEATQDWDFLAEQYPVVWRIYKGLMVGTHYGIRVDAFDGLVTWDAPHLALTWMDAVVAEEPVTPRRGKPIEINALWYSSLCWAHQWAEQLQQDDKADRVSLANQARRFATQIDQVKGSLQKYWQPALGYLYDTILPDDSPDATIRPNAVIALSLFHCGFSEAIGRSVLTLARDRLLTPYGLRSLDPADPDYIGRYQGGIWQRDRAYHQGTVWPWLIGPFFRAWQRFYPVQPIPFDWQPLLDHLQNQACIGSISEMFDGHSPHLPKGAVAQAWSVAEVLRHWYGSTGIGSDSAQQSLHPEPYDQ